MPNRENLSPFLPSLRPQRRACLLPSELLRRVGWLGDCPPGLLHALLDGSRFIRGSDSTARVAYNGLAP